MKAFINTLPGVLDAIEASAEVRNAFVFAAWRNIAGTGTSERTAPIAVEGRRLVVGVPDKTWKRNLESLAPPLLCKLNAALGKSLVDMIEFRVAPDAIERAPTKLEKDVEPTTTVPTELAISARSIRDDELRKTVLGAAANCLARPK